MVLYSDPPALIGLSVVLEVIALSCVGLRFWSRVISHSRFIVADWLVLIALVFSTGLTVLEIYGVSIKSLGYPLGATNLSPTVLEQRAIVAQRIEQSYLIIGIVTLGIIKLSIACLLHHIFKAKKTFRYVTRTWMVIIVIWTILMIISNFLSCGSHFMRTYTYQEAKEYCHWDLTGYKIYMITDCLTDFFTLCIPIPMIWTLQMSIQRKLLLASTFCVGLLSCASAAVKTWYFFYGVSGLLKLDAITLITALSAWNLLEVQVGIIASCAPCIRPAMRKTLPTDAISSAFDSLRDRLNLTSQGSARSRDRTNESNSKITMGSSNMEIKSKGSLGSQSSSESFHLGTYDEESGKFSQDGPKYLDTSYVHSADDASATLNGGTAITQTKAFDISYDTPKTPDRVHPGLDAKQFAFTRA